MKYTAILITFLTLCPLKGQTVFEENFESFDTGLDLTTEGYHISYSLGSGFTVNATVENDSTGKFARMQASPSGAAKMRILKTIEVVPGKLYAYEVETRGPFKRWTKVYSSDYQELFTSPEYKPSTDEEQTAWKKSRMIFTSPTGESQLNIGLYHYWSGTIDLDNIKVYETVRQSAYYVSNSDGDDDNFGTKDDPFRSLAKISSVNLQPGDTVFFKRGDRFDGHFVVNGSGSPEYPILITAYGEGDKPLLTGEVGAEGGGDYQQAILVENNDNIIFDGLEVQNERLVSRSGVKDTDAYGMRIQNTGSTVMRNITLRNMTFRDVFAVQPILDPDDFNTIQVAGLSVHSNKNKTVGQEKHIRDILVENCLFANLQRFGIQFKHQGGYSGVGNDSINRNMNIVVRNNEFSYNGGTGVLPNSTYNCLIENNIFDHPGASTDARMPGRGSSIWNYRSINTIMQYNMCISTRGYLDSYGIHIDNWNKNSYVQYNYMIDCEGGFVEILKGNKDSFYRFNVCVNSGWRKNPTWTNSNFTIWVNADRWGEPEDFAPSDGVYIYNNTVVIDSAFTTTISLDGKNMNVYNNIFSSTNGSGMGAQQSIVRNNGTPYFMKNNLFEGTVDSRWVNYDTDPIIGSPMFTDTLVGQLAYQIREESDAVGAGVAKTGPAVANAGYGIFKDIPKYPEVDFFGNPIDLTRVVPNIGACNLYNPQDSLEIDPPDTTVVDPPDTTIIDPPDTTVIDPPDTTVIDPPDTTDVSAILIDKEDGWLVYPQPAASMIHIIGQNTSGPTRFCLYDLRGQLVYAEERELLPSEKRIYLKLNRPPPSGIYILNIQNKGRTHTRRFIYHN